MEKKKAVKTKKKPDNTRQNHEMETLTTTKDFTSLKNKLLDERVAGDCDNNLLAINTDDTAAHIKVKVSSDNNIMLDEEKVNQNINHRKRKQSYNNYEEDVIDGFLIVSYSTVQQLESDGPIRPGAAVGCKANKSTKDKKKTKVNSKKGKKSENSKSISNSSNTETTEVVKKKKKKQVCDSVNDIISPSEVSPEIAKTKENFNVSKKEKMVDEVIKSMATPTLINDKVFDKDKLESNDLVIDSKSKSISDFSINAIQSLIKSPVNIAPTPPGSQLISKIIPPMTGLPAARSKTVSPLSLSFQRAVSSRGDTFNSFMGLDGNSLPGRSPITGGLSRKSESIFVDKSSSGNGGGRIFQISETSKIRVAVSNGNNQSNLALNNSVTSQFLKDRDMSRIFNASTNNARVTTPSDRSGSPKSRGSDTTHQHQHQHVHQHQHQHQHFHPPYPSHPPSHGHNNSSSTMGPVPPMAGPYSQMYCGGLPYNMSMAASHPTPAQHTSRLLTTVKGAGKWCGLHIKIARFIQKAKAERHSMITYDHTQGSRSNFHAFQAVQSRGHSYRDIDYHTQHYRSSISPPGNTLSQPTGGNLRSSLIRSTVEKDPFSRPRSFVPVHHSTKERPNEAHLPFGGLGSAFNGSTIRSDTIIKPRASPSRYTHSRIDYDRYQRSNTLPIKHESSSQFLHSAATYRHDTETHSETERHNRFTSAIFDKEKHNVNRFRTLTIDSRDRHSPTFMSRDYLGSMRKVSPRSVGLCLPSSSSSSSLLKSFESRYIEAPDTYPSGHSVNRVDVRSYSPAGRGVIAAPFPPIPSSRQSILPFTGSRYSGHPST